MRARRGAVGVVVVWGDLAPVAVQKLSLKLLVVGGLAPVLKGHVDADVSTLPRSLIGATRGGRGRVVGLRRGVTGMAADRDRANIANRGLLWRGALVEAEFYSLSQLIHWPVVVSQVNVQLDPAVARRLVVGCSLAGKLVNNRGNLDGKAVTNITEQLAAMVNLKWLLAAIAALGVAVVLSEDGWLALWLNMLVNLNALGEVGRRLRGGAEERHSVGWVFVFVLLCGSLKLFGGGEPSRLYTFLKLLLRRLLSRNGVAK